MIGGLTGTISLRGAGFVILDVGGVGYKVFVTAGTYQNLDEKATVSLHTHLVVREDALTLFGFLEQEELRFFEMLISVSGIGPKSALAILSLTDTETLRSAIVAGESSYLTKVSGIGRKNAEKIILELRDKCGALPKDTRGVSLPADVEVLEALESLGYGVREARDTLKNIPKEVVGTGERLKKALRMLSKQ